MPTVSIPEMNREVFETVVKSIYTDPKKASVREILANAVDANLEVNSHNPEKVNVQFDFDSISVRDFGTGMSPDTIRDIYGSMYQSTKRSKYKDGMTSANGEHGIGSKAPYGYLYQIEGGSHAQYYIVNTIFEGVKYNYVMFLNKDGIPSYELLHSAPSDERKGTEVVLPFSYIDNSIYSNDIKKLISTIIPFYHKDFGTLINISGNNTSLINTIKSVCDTIVVYKNLYFVDYETINEVGSNECLIKYKNIVYPTNYEVKKNSQSTVEMFYDIKLDTLNKPLLANRSRDRIDWVDNQQTDVDMMLYENITQLRNNLFDLFNAIITYTPEKNIVKYNAKVKIISKSLYLNYTGTLLADIDNLVRKRVVRKSVAKSITDSDVCNGHKELMIWSEVFRIDSTILESLIKSTGLESVRLVSMYIENFGFSDFVDDSMFKTKESDALDYLQRSPLKNIRRATVNQVDGTDTIEYHSVTQRDIRSMPFEFADESAAFMIRDSKSFKLQTHALISESEVIDRVYVIDPLSYEPATGIKETFSNDGVNNVYTTSDINKSHRECIDELKSRNKKVKSSGNKRIKGVTEFMVRLGEDYIQQVKRPERRTITSDEIMEYTSSFNDVYVMRRTESYRVFFSQNNKPVAFEYTHDNNNNVHLGSSYMSFQAGENTSEISDKSLCMMIPVGSMLLIVDDTEYNNVIQYFNGNNIYSLVEHIEKTISGMDFHVIAVPNAEDVVQHLSCIKEKRRNDYVENNVLEYKTDAAFVAYSFFKQALNTYTFKDFDHPFTELRKKYSRVEFDIFEKLCTYHGSEEVITLAENLISGLESSSIARTIVSNINIYTLRRDDEASRELTDHIFDITGCNYLKENYLTD